MSKQPQLPELEAGPTNDTAALTCYALDWRELALTAQMQRDELLTALEGILYHFVPTQGNLKVEQEMITKAHAAIAKAKS